MELNVSNSIYKKRGVDPNGAETPLNKNAVKTRVSYVFPSNTMLCSPKQPFPIGVVS